MAQLDALIDLHSVAVERVVVERTVEIDGRLPLKKYRSIGYQCVREDVESRGLRTARSDDRWRAGTRVADSIASAVDVIVGFVGV